MMLKNVLVFSLAAAAQSEDGLLRLGQEAIEEDQAAQVSELVSSVFSEILGSTSAELEGVNEGLEGLDGELERADADQLAGRRLQRGQALEAAPERKLVGEKIIKIFREAAGSSVLANLLPIVAKAFGVPPFVVNGIMNLVNRLTGRRLQRGQALEAAPERKLKHVSTFINQVTKFYTKKWLTSSGLEPEMQKALEIFISTSVEETLEKITKALGNK